MGEGPDGTPFRVEYAIVDLGDEKIVARYLGPADAVAFNLGLLRRSLESLEAAPLLTDEVEGPLQTTFERVPYPGGAAAGVVPRSDWSREPASYASCSRVPVAEIGLATSPAGDFTVVLRALRWTDGTVRPAGGRSGLRPGGGCAATRATGAASSAWACPSQSWGTFVERPGEVLLLEVEAPEAKLPFVHDLYREWLESVAE